MNKIFLFLFLPVCLVFSQNKDRVFRIASESKGILGYSYHINILELSNNKQYRLTEQKYVSKKFARKNIPSRFSNTFGLWSVKNDTLKLLDNETKQDVHFLLKKNHLIFLFNNEEPTEFHWIEVND